MARGCFFPFHEGTIPCQTAENSHWTGVKTAFIAYEPCYSFDPFGFNDWRCRLRSWLVKEASMLRVYLKGQCNAILDHKSSRPYCSCPLIHKQGLISWMGWHWGGTLQFSWLEPPILVPHVFFCLPNIGLETFWSNVFFAPRTCMPPSLWHTSNWQIWKSDSFGMKDLRYSYRPWRGMKGWCLDPKGLLSDTS